ncbi:ATP-binding protein [Spirillospora sp. NPDC127200]
MRDHLSAATTCRPMEGPGPRCLRIDLAPEALAVIGAAASLAGTGVQEYVLEAVSARLRRDAQAADAPSRHTPRPPPALPGPGWRTWELAWAETAAAQARRLVREALAERGTGADADAAAVMVSELVTNAFQHGARPILLGISLDDGVLYCHVGDGSPAPPDPATPTTADEHGRGLGLLAGMASSHGWYPAAAGKIVWFSRRLETAPCAV